MPLIALKAHYDGHAVVFDEPCDLPPETPLQVVVNPQGTPGQPSDKANRAAAFQAAFGALRGKLSSTDEFMARKANVGFGSAQPTATGSCEPTTAAQSVTPNRSLSEVEGNITSHSNPLDHFDPSTSSGHRSTQGTESIENSDKSKRILK